ncbi:MAG: hypothetical protein NT084_00635 [Bacteroidetes bacterium]|nr:hypothetical protein [Bacteroidota bacterium]
MSKSNVDHSLLRDLNIWIDSYNDLFSDFDSRPFSERAISDDFIREMNKLTEEKDELIKTLRFQIPVKERDAKIEDIIIKRLSKDFKREYAQIAREVNNNRHKGLIMAACGISALMIAVLITTIEMKKLGQNFLRILFEPAGWFLIWSGLEKIFFDGKTVKRKRDYYARLEKCKIEFVSI